MQACATADFLLKVEYSQATKNAQVRVGLSRLIKTFNRKDISQDI